MKNLDNELDWLAARFSNELATSELQLEALGAAHLPTSELLRLQGKYSERVDAYHTWQKRFLSLAMWSPGLLVVGAFLFWVGLLRFSLMVLSAFPAVLIVAGWGIVILYKKYGTLNQQEIMLEAIEMELLKRQKSTDKTRT